MILLFRNGTSVWVRQATSADEEGTWLIVRGKRMRELARFRIDALAGHFFDNEEVTSYGFVSVADERDA